MSHTYRADLLPVLRAQDGSVITEPSSYTVPCGMNSILELNSQRIKLVGLLRSLLNRNTANKAIVMSTWRGINGSNYQGEYEVTYVHICADSTFDKEQA